VGPAWALDWTGHQPGLRQRLEGGPQVVRLDGEVAEAGADVHPAVGWPMHEFEGNELLAGELEHGQGSAVAKVDPTDLAIPESRVETHGGVQVRDAVRRVQSPHSTTVIRPRAFDQELTDRLAKTERSGGVRVLSQEIGRVGVCRK